VKEKNIDKYAINNVTLLFCYTERFVGKMKKILLKKNNAYWRQYELQKKCKLEAQTSKARPF